jgi:hypothetical protein
MKKLLIGMLFLGLTSLSYSQASAEVRKNLKLDGITLMPANLGYLSVVGAGTKSLKILNLQRAAASFDIKKSSIYNRKARYHVFNFDQKEAHIQATYDRDGRIVKSYERFNDVILEPDFRNSIYLKFPGWNIESNKYEVLYSQGKNPRKVYKLKLKKGNDTKRMKFDINGNIM